MIAMIAAAQAEVAKRAKKLNIDKDSLYLKLLASPWSPPAWMKLPVFGVEGAPISG
jgi:glucosylceramidase